MLDKMGRGSHMLLELLIVSNNEHDHHGFVIDAHSGM